MQSRIRATRIIQEVLQNRASLTAVLENHLQNNTDHRENAFIKDLCYGVFRWQPQLDGYVDFLLKKPLRAKDLDIQILIWLGLYQIQYQRTPEHAAVSATVETCRKLKKDWAKGIVNATLRRFIREQEEIKNVLTKDRIKYAHPDWLIEQIQQDWPEYWAEILIANQQHPPLTLRINRKATTRQAYSKELKQHNILYEFPELTDTAITLCKACDITTLPGYQRGEFAVQDLAAQLAASLLDLQPGHRLLDACSAPGGKTGHCLEIVDGTIDLTALDNNQQRMALTNDNLTRLGHQTNLIVGDASTPDVWWDKKPYDRILLDVPCTASGIIRRHPDIKLLRQPEDLQAIVAVQKKILDNIWPLLRKGGKLVYSTCSIFKQENEQQIESFLNRHKEAQCLPIDSNWGLDRKYGRQILPGESNMDGFFYTCLLKAS